MLKTTSGGARRYELNGFTNVVRVQWQVPGSGFTHQFDNVRVRVADALLGPSQDFGLHLHGDATGDRIVNSADIDALFDAIGMGHLEPRFDLNHDAIVDHEDVDILVQDILATNYGDANLDGIVDGTDRTIWLQHRFQAGTAWSQADFNGDGTTDGSDFNLWNQHRVAVGASNFRQAQDALIVPAGDVVAQQPLNSGPLDSSVEFGRDPPGLRTVPPVNAIGEIAVDSVNPPHIAATHKSFPLLQRPVTAFTTARHRDASLVLALGGRPRQSTDIPSGAMLDDSRFRNADEGFSSRCFAHGLLPLLVQWDGSRMRQASSTLPDCEEFPKPRNGNDR